ncbi:gamma-glutamylcyclotransferase-like isoform X3 [Hippocampus zosterae]|uniref:gamma-glutamylcyclotransferase-like isoform X3 n=1 Tax=Hippocampus zosterae TaxID=109293 RepID=UPI00223D8615|nr:gamma-glutamylcyclotransferase-like isoform X3 [Hippocampus zosterae]
MAPGGTGTFAYFAFGSNMLRERLQLENPSATYLDTGRLKDYQLDFGVWDRGVENSWHGGVATIQESPGSEAGRRPRRYLFPAGGESGEQQPRGDSVQDLPDEQLPCSSNLTTVVCCGAEQNGLPDDYVDRLRAVETNNYMGPSMLDCIEMHAN